MTAVLLNGPLWLAACVVFTLGIGLMLIVISLLSRAFGPQVVAGEFENVAGTKLAFLEPLLGIALFYAFGEAVLHRHGIVKALEAERAALSVLAWNIDHADPSHRGPAFRALDDYLIAVTEDEWPAMARGAESPRAFAALVRLGTVLRETEISSDPRWPVRAKSLMGRIAEQRDIRLARAGMRLSTPIIATAATTILFLSGFVWLLGAVDYRPRLMMTLLLYTAILSVFLGVVVLYNPFLGDWALSPNALFELRDRG